MFHADSKFLIVEDSATSRGLVRLALRQLGYSNIEEAADGATGLKKVQEATKLGKPYSVVFCDINMPELNGLKLLETVKLNKDTSNTPFVMITTEGDKNIVLKAVMSGVSGYMVKPFGVEDIKNKLVEVYKRVSGEHGSVV